MATTYLYAMGPPCCIRDISQTNNWPRCSHRNLQLSISMGQPYCNGDSSQNINWPRCKDRQPHAHMQWAHPIATVTAFKTSIGPGVRIDSHMHICNGPTLLHQQHFPKIISLGVAIGSHMHMYHRPTLLHRGHYPNK